MVKYIILVSAGEQAFFLGNYGEYVSTLDEALKFNDVLDAKIYVDKHGLEKITSVRKIHLI